MISKTIIIGFTSDLEEYPVFDSAVSFTGQDKGFRVYVLEDNNILDDELLLHPVNIQAYPLGFLCVTSNVQATSIHVPSNLIGLID
jgi:hypothetical protein